MKRKLYYKLFGTFFICCMCLINMKCVEPFEPSTLTFEDILVVEAIITDELKSQEVLLSRTTPLEDDKVFPETNAIVTVVDSEGNEHSFNETAPGVYLSAVLFSAEMGVDYQLRIQTGKGESYTSNNVVLSGLANIDNVRAVRIENDLGIDGAQILVDSSSEGQVSYLRYEHEETYKIVSFFTPFRNLVIVSEDPPLVEFRLKTKEERTCFKTQESNSFVLFQTQGLSDNRVSNIPVRFIPSDDFILRERYSINVRQFTHSREGWSFYEKLRDFSDLESVFTQVQTGFLKGNISSVENPNRKVLGFFDVSSVDTERIFFNFKEVFPDKSRPMFFRGCEFECNPPPPESAGGGCRPFRLEQPEDFIPFLKDGFYKYATTNEGGIQLVVAPCVDCTTIGTNIVPDFWEE